MLNPDIIRLAVGEIPGPIMIGRIPSVWAGQLGSADRWVRCSSYTLAKQIVRHGDYGLGYYEQIAWILENGEVIFDHHEHVLHFVGDTRGTLGRRTKVTVKATMSRNELYMTSAHLLRDRDYDRMKRKAAKSKN